MASLGSRDRLRALVTGGPGRSCALVAALERQGFSVIAEHHPAGGAWGPLRLPSGPLHCYAQLPWGSPSDGDPAWMPDGLAARLDLLAAVATRLGPRAAVMLAVDEPEPPRWEASADLLAALALVILEESGRPETRVVALPAAQLCGPPEAQRALVDGSVLLGLGRARAEVASSTRR